VAGVPPAPGPAVAAVSVTDSGSHIEVSAATRNDCEKCKRYRDDDYDPHCRQCHSGKHRRCRWCKGCLPDGHRRDRWYCSSTCRVRASAWRRGPEGERERQLQREWEQSDEGRAWVAEVKALSAFLGDPTNKATVDRVQRAARTGETCAICQRTLGNLIFWRQVDTGEQTDERQEDQRRCAPVCPECHAGAACSAYLHQPFLCERCCSYGGEWVYDLSGSWFHRRWSCREAGPAHRNLYCEKCHPRQWVTGRCPGCERTVMVRGHGNRHWRYSNEWEASPDRHAEQLVFCSVRCRSRIDRAAAATRRAEQRAEGAPYLCAGCSEVLDGHRADTRYCSPACRQRAYRRRKAAVS
jgi:hypothetical protein